MYLKKFLTQHPPICNVLDRNTKMQMAFSSSSTAKLTELPLLHNSLHLRSSYSSLHLLLSHSYSKLRPYCSIRTTQQNNRRTHRNQSDSRRATAPWLNKWPSGDSRGGTKTREETRPRNNSNSRRPRKEEDEEADGVGHQYFDGDRGRSSIERIVHRLRNLELDDGEGEVEEESGDDEEGEEVEGGGEEKLGNLLQRNWSRPDAILLDEKDDETLLPWERGESWREEEERGKAIRPRAPSMAELTIEDVELRRLRTLGMTLKDRINIPKAGLTQAVLDKIHDKWRRSELVRLKFHETLAHDMRTAHEIVERRTTGLVIWRSGSVMVVYKGSSYERPSSRPYSTNNKDDSVSVCVPDISSADIATAKHGNGAIPASEKIEPSLKNPIPVENMTEEEAEYNSLLDDLGPRFVEWWGTGVLPIDADLLPPTLPGYKTPFRFLPTGMRSRLTNAEMTNLRKLAKTLPSHFSLGRNRNHQGLAQAIVKLWEKSLVAKIAVKRGIQNTNNKLMSEELKKLTGGILLLRNKYYIVIYRGKDFLPTSVAATLAERQLLTKEIQDVEEKARMVSARIAPSNELEEKAPAGTLAEFLEAQARWGREVSFEEHEKMKYQASRARYARIVRKIKHKLAIAQAKKLRAERLLAKIEASMIPAGPCDDQEILTDEERFMFRRIGLKMKAYLPMGIRGVFDGVIENMHLHWKHRELVKLISKQKTLLFVEDSARLLEYESGGILVAIERVPKGYALIYYRGKNYQRPITLRPRNLLTKAKALKRSVSMQRHEALSQHISELEKTIEQMKSEMSDSAYGEAGENWSLDEENLSSCVLEVTQIEREFSHMEYDNDDDDDYDDDDYDDDENLDLEDDEE